MPSMTINLTEAQWDRLNPALQKYRDAEEHPAETDRQLALRWLKMMAHGEVWSYERDHQGSDNAKPDFEMEVL